MIGVGSGNLLQYSCLENPMYKGAWWAAVHGVTESDMTELLSMSAMYSSVLCKLRSLIEVKVCVSHSVVSGSL